MQNSLATRRANGSFCSTRSTVNPSCLFSLQDDAANFVDDIWLNPFGRLIENQQLRLENERPPDRQLLLLPAGKIASAPLQHLFQRGKQIEDMRRNGPGAVLAHAQPNAQVFLHRQMRKNLTPLWHVADTNPGPLLGVDVSAGQSARK